MGPRGLGIWAGLRAVGSLNEGLRALDKEFTQWSLVWMV